MTSHTPHTPQTSLSSITRTRKQTATLEDNHSIWDLVINKNGTKK
ncbi:hypothetical protein [Crocosphaera sp.]|nr:hypothetical protein [Crocosphaera sp.]MDJ0583187.1 hypothetical protein [Crocosphaera sp.]